MIWYKVPAEISMVLLVAFLLCAAGQFALVLKAGELVFKQHGLKFFRRLYLLLTGLSLISLTELVVAVASIEGGVYLPIPSLPRYAFIVPALFYLYRMITALKLPSQINPAVAGFFIPLLRLPFADRLPAPLPVVFAMITAAWFIGDALWMLLSMRKQLRSDINRSILLHVVHHLNHGVCIADFRGRILEVNPAFEKLCENLGVAGIDHISELDARLKKQQASGQLSITTLQDGQAIRVKERVCFLRRDTFTLRKRKFLQLALSDITANYHKTMAMERKNEHLGRKNIELENAMSNASAEAALQEREKLCRASHDHWSQRLAVAGLSLDILIEQDHSLPPTEKLLDILDLLESPVSGESDRVSALSELLSSQAQLYQKLGVEVITSGKAEFSPAQQTALSLVLREALANAVRHAYARQIHVSFSENDSEVGMMVQNSCLDDETVITQGRGMHDMQARVRDAGGIFHCEKNRNFLLRVTFRKNPQEQEVLTG